jgi:DNA polymerase-3 subunit delta'
VWSVVGHEWAVDLLRQSLTAGKQSHAYLFVGPRQVGKRTLAKSFAQALLCQGADAPCGACRSCQLVERDRHPDVQLIEPGEDSIKIDEIRDVLRSVTLSPVEASHRVLIISRFDQATPSAANALLKTLEEPPSTVVLLLTANRTDQLLPTIVSRCQVIPLRLLPVSEVVAVLRERGLDQERAELLGSLSQGRIGWALSAARDERVLLDREKALEGIISMAHGSYVERFAWAESLSRKPERVDDMLRTLASWWRDVLLVAAGSGAPIANVDRKATLVEWADRYDIEMIKDALRSIHDTVWRIERNANLRLALEVLMLDLPGSSYP